MSLATGQIVRDYCNLGTSATDDLLLTHLNAAARELRTWVGHARYAEAEAAGEDEQIRKDLREAEAFLTYHYAIDYLGLKHTEAGFAAEGQLGDASYRYLGTRELGELKARAWGRAVEAARPYMSSGVRFHHGQAGAADES